MTIRFLAYPSHPIFLIIIILNVFESLMILFLTILSMRIYNILVLKLQQTYAEYKS